MKYINITKESGDDGECDKIVLEGDSESLKQFHLRLGNVINEELSKVPEIKFSDAEPLISFNGQASKFVVRRTVVLSKRKSGFNKDVIIALSVIIMCVVLVLIALFKTKHGGGGGDGF